MKIRRARLEDASRLLEIYRPYVEETAVSFEYDLPSLDEFTRRMENIMKNYPYLVAEENGELLGYAYASSFHARIAYIRCVEMTIYLKENQRGNGLGRALYEEMERLLEKQGILNLYSCIAATERTEDEHLTPASIRFHEKMGYKLNGSFHQCGYKFGKWYDMVWMEKEIGLRSENPKPFIPFPEL